MRSLLLALVSIGVSLNCMAITVSISVWYPPVCSYANGNFTASVSGGVPPYTYQWSNGSTEQQIGGPAGFYTVTVTDALGDEATAQMNISANTTGYGFTYWMPGCPEGIPRYLFANLDVVYPGGFANFMVNPPYYGTAILEQTYPGVQVLRVELFDVYPGQVLSDVSVTDENGCQFHLSYTVVPAGFDWIDNVLVMQVNGACSGGSNGSIKLFVPAQAWASGVVLAGPNGQWAQLHQGPAGEMNFSGVPAGTYHILNKVSWNQPDGGPPPDLFEWNYYYLADCHDTLATVVVPDLGFTCRTVSGKLFIDTNGNCAPNSPSSEPGIPNTVIEIQPGDHFTITDQLGNYSINLPLGTYTIIQQNPLYAATCDAETTPLVVNTGFGTITRNIPTVSLQGLDLAITMSSGPARPGFQLSQGVRVTNLTGTAAGTASVTMTFDAVLQFISATPAPTSVSGNTITWNTTNITAFQWRHFSVQLQVPADVGLLGTVLTSTAGVTSMNTDVDLTNNTTIQGVTVTGSYDPNDKLVATNSGPVNSEYSIEQDDWLYYTIRFQNTGTDTAFQVVVTDTLSSRHDPATFQLGASSHNYSVSLNDRVLRFMFANIMLPDSNVNEPKSHGHVSFRIKVKNEQDLQPGDQITNMANIFFDFNPPVITDPSVLTVPTSGVQVNVKVKLGGPYNSSTGMMNDQLRSQGLIPLNEPYAALGYSFVNGGSGTTTSTILSTTGPDAIVDWMILELRDPSQPQTIVASKPVLLQRDGDLVQADGNAVFFPVPAGQYHVAVRHRNHLGVMTASPVALSGTSTSIDFTSSATATWGTAARRNMAGTMVLWPGDTNFDGSVSYMGAGNDRDPMLQMIAIPTQVVTSTYSSRDVNLDGLVKYTGPNNDRDLILQTIGGLVPTAVKVGQLP